MYVCKYLYEPPPRTRTADDEFTFDVKIEDLIEPVKPQRSARLEPAAESHLRGSRPIDARDEVVDDGLERAPIFDVEVT